jgi:hypothetical protein
LIDATETEALATFMESHLDVVEQMRSLVEYLLIKRGLPAGLVSSMLIGGGIGMLIEGGLSAQQVRDFANNVVEDTIRKMREMPRA